MNKRFKIIVSQKRDEIRDNQIHLRDEGKPDQLIAHIRFKDLSFLSEEVIDKLLGDFARDIAKKITEHRACESEEPEWEDWQESRARMEAKRIILSLGMPLATSEGYRK